MFHLILALALQLSWGATRVSTEWVHTTRTAQDRIELLPHERTRPIIQGEILYFANLAGSVFAVHRTDGYVLWKRTLPSGVSGAFALGRSKLYVGDRSGKLWALHTRDGSLVWDEPFTIQSEWLSPPAIHKDKIFAVSASDDLYAISEGTGKELWHYSHRGDEKMTVRGAAAPVVYGSEVYQGFSDGFFAALAVKDGKVGWVKRLKSKDRFYDIDATPFVDASQVITSSYDGKLYSLNRLNGEIEWVFPMGSASGFLVEDKTIYVSGVNSTFAALDKSNGAVIWKTTFEKGIGFQPVRVGDYLVATTSSDPFYVLNPSDGKVIWKESLGAGTMVPSVSSGDNWFYCMSNYGNLYSYRIKAASGFENHFVHTTPSGSLSNKDRLIPG